MVFTVRYSPEIATSITKSKTLVYTFTRSQKNSVDHEGSREGEAAEYYVG